MKLVTRHSSPVTFAAVLAAASATAAVSDFSTTIGNYQSRNYYWRTLVGIGTNGVGVAPNLQSSAMRHEQDFPWS